MKYQKQIKQFILHIFIIFIVFAAATQYNFAFASTNSDVTTELTKEQKQEIKEKKDEYNDKVKKYEKKVKKEEKKKQDLQGSLGIVKQSLGNTQRTIDDVIADIEKKELEIERHDAQIKSLNNQMILYKTSLSDTVRRFYYATSVSSVSSVIENDGSRRFLETTDALDDMRSKIIGTVHQVEQAKQLQYQKKAELSSLKDEKEKLLAEHKQTEAQRLSPNRGGDGFRSVWLRECQPERGGKGYHPPHSEPFRATAGVLTNRHADTVYRVQRRNISAAHRQARNALHQEIGTRSSCQTVHGL